jgi:hypothetical protein
VILLKFSDVPKMNHRWDGKSKPEAQNNYMLCDILLADIQDAIHSEKYRRDFCAVRHFDILLKGMDAQITSPNSLSALERVRMVLSFGLQRPA